MADVVPDALPRGWLRLSERVERETRAGHWLVVGATLGNRKTLGCGRVGRDPRRSDTVEAMRIVGVRIGAPFARLLVELVEEAGFDGTARKIAQAIELQVTTEAPLTTADHEAILAALGSHCPAGLSRLRRELLEEQRSIRGPLW